MRMPRINSFLLLWSLSLGSSTSANVKGKPRHDRELSSLDLSSEHDAAESSLPTMTHETTFRNLQFDCVPSKKKTCAPTRAPTRPPTRAPTKFPTRSPTRFPTRVPTLPPVHPPTRSPTLFPVASPTTPLPTFPQPTPFPTFPKPTLFPTLFPTQSPTFSPTTLSPTISQMPTPSPSSMPSDAPSVVPSSMPTSSPSSAPSTSAQPSGLPSAQPSISQAPTMVPRGTIDQVHGLDSDTGKVTAWSSTCAAPLPNTESRNSSFDQLFTYEYTLNIDFGVEVSSIIPDIELQLAQSLQDQYLDCFPWNVTADFLVYRVDSRPLDQVDASKECSVAERTGAGACHKMLGQYTATIFYYDENSEDTDQSTRRRLQSENSETGEIEQAITDPNVLNAFEESLDNYFNSDQLTDIPGVAEASFNGITNSAVPVEKKRNVAAISAGSAVAGAAIIGGIVLLGLTVKRKRKRRLGVDDSLVDQDESLTGIYDQKYDLNELHVDDNRSLASKGSQRVYIVTDILEEVSANGQLQDLTIDRSDEHRMRPPSFIPSEKQPEQPDQQLLANDSQDLEITLPSTEPTYSPRLEDRKYEVKNTVDL